MKKLFYIAAAFALSFFAGSCQQENLEPVAANGTVTYTVQVPGALATKAADGVNNVTELVYEVYRTAGEKVTAFSDADNLLYHRTAEIKNGVATIALEFVNDQNFTVLFWAHDPANGVYNVENLTDVKVAQSTVANTQATAAFSGVDFVINCVSEQGGNVNLVRPVAQLNLATTNASLRMDDTVITVSNSSVKVYGLSTSFNVATQEAGDATGNFAYTSATVPGGAFTADYTHLGMNYLGFVPVQGVNVKVDYLLETSEGNIDNTIQNVPVKPNFRTNIVGNLISGTSEYKVELDAEWGTPDEEYEIWDGKTLTPPSVNAAGEYVVAKPSEWAYLAAQQNPATKAAPAPVVINLTSDLDFGGNELTGLVAARDGALTVNGNGYAVLNAKVVSGTNDNGTNVASLFISLPNSTLCVKDLDVKNVNVVTSGADPYAGVIGSYVEGTMTVENVNVCNSLVYGIDSMGAIIGFLPANGTATVNDVLVDGVKLTNADVDGESGAVGGFVGRVAGKLTASNVKVANTTIEAYVGTDSEQKRSIAKFIGNFVGGGIINVTGASLENVTIVAKNELAESQSCLYTEYLGGWRGNGGTVSINGVEITKDEEDVTIDTPSELAQALADAADGAVIPVAGEIAATALSAGDGKNITIVGMSDGASINASASTNYVSTSGNITFQNLTIKLNSNPGAHYNVGFHNNGGTHVYDNCKFEGCITAWGDCTYNNCEFVNNTKGKYAAWVYAGTVVYNNCTFIGNDRAAKVFNENADKGLRATYNNCTFKSSTANKTAVEVDVNNNTNAYTYVVITNPTVENMGVAEHYAVGEGVCNLETVNGSKYGLGIVNLDGKGYSVAHTAAQLQALTNAGKDVTIQFAQDITGDFTYEQNNNEHLVIDGNNKVFNGTVTIRARAGKDAANTTVIKNINFKTTADEEYFILSSETNYYPNNLTVSNCTFEGSGAESDVVPVTIKSASNFVLENCTATKVHSLIQNTSGWNLTIRDCEVTESGRGLALGTVQGVTVENVKVAAPKYGIRMDAGYNNNAVIKDCEISAFIPVVVRKASVNSTIVFEGTNTMTPANTDGLWCAIGTSEYEANGALPTAPTGNVTVTLNDAGLDAAGVYGAYNL